MSQWRASLVIDGKSLEDFHKFTRATKATDVSLTECGDKRANGKKGGETAETACLRVLKKGPLGFMDLSRELLKMGFNGPGYGLKRLKAAGLAKSKKGIWSLTKGGK